MKQTTKVVTGRLRVNPKVTIKTAADYILVHISWDNMAWYIFQMNYQALLGILKLPGRGPTDVDDAPAPAR